MNVKWWLFGGSTVDCRSLLSSSKTTRCCSPSIIGRAQTILVSVKSEWESDRLTKIKHTESASGSAELFLFLIYAPVALGGFLKLSHIKAHWKLKQLHCGCWHRKKVVFFSLRFSRLVELSISLRSNYTVHACIPHDNRAERTAKFSTSQFEFKVCTFPSRECSFFFKLTGTASLWLSFKVLPKSTQEAKASGTWSSSLSQHNISFNECFYLNLM